VQSFVLPFAEIDRRVDHFSFWFALKYSHIIRAACHTQSTSNALFDIHDRETIPFRNGSHLAAVDAGTTVIACNRIDDSIIVCKRHRIVQPIYGDASQDTAAATTAVAYISHTLHHIADCMNKPYFLAAVK
jgi:hypothetical protein